MEVQMIYTLLKRSVLISVVLLPLILISCGSEEKTTTNGDVEKTESTKTERKVKYWQAPMNPSEIYDRPGKSAMGMDLVPVYEGEDEEAGGTIRIDPVTSQNMGVRTAFVEKVDFTRVLRTVARVDYNEELLYAVSTKISGWVEKLFVEYEGEEVKKGQALLEIYSPELVTTQQEFLLALKNKELIGSSNFKSVRDGAESLLKASRQRLSYWDIPESEIKKLEDTGKVRKTLTLESPADGIIIKKNVIEGLHVKSGVNLYQIADLSKVWVYASIYDDEAAWIKEGQDVEIELSYSAGKILKGRVTYIYPYLNKKARDIQVRIEINNPDLELKPGMYANILIKTSPIKNSLVVPTEAVIRSGQRNMVFIALDKGRFEPREVVLAEESEDGKIRITSGLEEHEKIVVSAQFLIDSESRLQEAIQKMLAERSGASPKPAKKKMDMSGEKDSNKSGMDSDMKCGDGMDMEKKSNTKMKKESDMKCGDGMDMEKKNQKKMDHDKDGHDN
jgi:multidrug efflux pump subunit AcrA (membrane-fusion protein)